MKKIDIMNQQLSEQFRTIVGLLAKQYGMDIAGLSDLERERLEEEAGELTENWDSAVLDNSALAGRPGTELQEALKIYNYIGEAILDIQDADVARRVKRGEL